MEPSKIKLDSSPLSSPLSPGKKVINSTSKKQAAANILIQIPNPKDVDYEPIKMNESRPPQVHLPEGTNYKSALSLFSLFFPDSLFWEIANNTNTYAQMSRPPIPLANLPRTNQRPWYNTSVPELKIFVGILIYMGVHREPSVECYWRTKQEEGPLHTVRLYMSLVRFQQLKRYIHISPWEIHRKGANGMPTLPDIQGIIDDAEQCDPELLPSVWWHKVEPALTQLRKASMLYYTPSSNVSIDECMVRCFGRSSHTYKMPSKPIPQGYKLYALADHGYIWMFTPSSRSEGLIETTRVDGLTTTGSMVLDLVKYLPKQANTYSIYLDNYFTSIALFEKLRTRQIGACGTTRPYAAGKDFPVLMKQLICQLCAIQYYMRYPCGECIMSCLAR
jgi:hypothetical protein